jgi:hypothetical protein
MAGLDAAHCAQLKAAIGSLRPSEMYPTVPRHFGITDPLPRASRRKYIGQRIGALLVDFKNWEERRKEGR